MAELIQEQTMSGATIVEAYLAVALGQRLWRKWTVQLPMTPEQCAVANGTATPEQQKFAKKQRRFIVVREPYYPTVEDMKEAMHWLTERGFGKAPQTVPVEGDNVTTGFKMEFRPSAPGCDPTSLGGRVVNGEAKPQPGDSYQDERIVGCPDDHPMRGHLDSTAAADARLIPRFANDADAPGTSWLSS